MRPALKIGVGILGLGILVYFGSILYLVATEEESMIVYFVASAFVLFFIGFVILLVSLIKERIKDKKSENFDL